MFGSIGGSELLVLAIIGLLVFGPRRLPEMGRKLAGWVQEFRKAAGDMKAAIEKEASLGDVRKVAEEFHQSIRQEAAGISVEPARAASEEPKSERGGPEAS
ncbi:MAG TPA: Sec-independent protein translocase protein TatB [Verrucomicrobiae bacterium]|nr:Sec-independent protein translocase protein TatB [Verrucomicrobiae bacterium]